jgi:hypothetical protein
MKGQGYWINMVEGNNDHPLDDFSGLLEEQRSPVIKSTPLARGSIACVGMVEH